ncbi:MAG TPA: GGDEF domain-containing protein [Syntrophales bacterium]|nr:GGDEF domain-containing protein [Syntrophales bacterium]
MDTSLASIADCQVGIPEINVNNLIVELDHYRRQSEWLAKINELHGRLAGAVDLAGMIEAFSIWLMPVMAHDLIGYEHNKRRRHHLFCSCHGPERRSVMSSADKMFRRLAKTDGDGYWSDKNCHLRSFRMDGEEDSGFVVLLRRGESIEPMEERLIREALDILREPLQRVLDYEDIFEQARRDSLTGLPNRRVYEERIVPLLDSARRHGHPMTLASMDLDKFKLINDTFGHARGDKVLQTVAMTMAAMVRKSDLLVRMGGDEFLLVMPDTEMDAAQSFTSRVCQAVADLDIRVSATEKLGVSIGLVQYHPDMTRDSWTQRADEALYQAKGAGRARISAAQSPHLVRH